MTDRTATGFLGLFLICIYALTAGGHYGGDGFWNYLTAQSLVIDQDVAIGDRTFLVKEMQEQYAATAGTGTVGKAGRRYSKYGLGLPLIETPFYAIGHLLSTMLPRLPADYLTLFTTSMTNVIVCVLWGLLFFNFAQSLGYQRTTVLWLTAMFSLGSMAFPYSGYGFSEPLVGIALLGATASFYQYRQTHSPTSLVLGGFWIGLAMLTKVYILVVLPIFLFYAWPTLKPNIAKHTLALVGPVILFLILIAWHNQIRYDSIFQTGYHLDTLVQKGGYQALWPTQILTAAYGYLFSTGRGLIFFLPVVLLAPLAFKAFKHAVPNEANLFLGLLGVHFFPLLVLIDWHGGSNWGPRYLLPVIPFLILPLGILIENSESGRQTTKYLGIAGFLFQLPGALINPHMFVRFVLDKRLGDLIFHPGHPGDLIFSPYLSPILGGYYQLTSGIARYLTGNSLNYTISSGVERKIEASLASYDLIDTWWINALRTGFLSTGATVGLLLGIAFLLAASVYAATKLRRWAGDLP